MRGKRVSRAARTLDVVLVAVKYSGEGHHVTVAKGYERRGFVWGDLVLFERQDLIEMLKAKKKVMTGKLSDLPGDFMATAPVYLLGDEGSERLVADGHQANGDDLGLPLF